MVLGVRVPVSWSCRFEVLVGDWLFAVGAQAARADTLAERGAVLASLGPEVAGLARRAFVDGAGHAGLDVGDVDCGGVGGVAAPPRCFAACVATEALPADGLVAGGADRAGGRRGVVA